MPKKLQTGTINSGSVNLSILADEVITDFIGQRPGLKATLEVESNIVVRGNYSLLRSFFEKVIETSVNFNDAAQHHSIIFGRSKEDLRTFFLMNNELGTEDPSKVSFGTFKYLDKKDIGTEMNDIQNIIAEHSGEFWGIGKKDVGSIFYFSVRS